MRYFVGTISNISITIYNFPKIYKALKRPLFLIIYIVDIKHWTKSMHVREHLGSNKDSVMGFG